MPPPMRLRTGSARPNSTASLLIVVDSPPGMTSASTSSSSPGRRTDRARAPQASSARRCSRTSPWSASTPTTGSALTVPPGSLRGAPPGAAFPSSLRSSPRRPRAPLRSLCLLVRSAGRLQAPLRSPAALGESVRYGDVVDVDADHGLAQAPGHLRHHVGVVVERGRLDDRGAPLGRVTGLEDARADEHALGAELHHHRRVGGGGDTA